MAEEIILPQVTVLMPVYNAEKFLDEAISSILSQTFKNFEFLIINDGSSDNSLDIINNYSKKDNRIRVITRQNKGFVSTLNEGLSQAKSNLIARMDADDIVLPDRLAFQYTYLQEHPNCSVVGCQVQIIDENSNKKNIDPRPTQDVNLRLFLAYGCALSGPTVMFRKDIIQSIGGFREDALPAEDYACWTRLVEQYSETEIANLPEVLYLYRENSQGISMSNKIEQIKMTIKVGGRFRAEMIRRHWEFLSLSIHRGWMHDCNNVEDIEQREKMRTIYYTIQTWFIRDQSQKYFLLSRLNLVKLYLYTFIINKKDLHLLRRQPVSHTFPS